jgi:hypothetical protein
MTISIEKQLRQEIKKYIDVADIKVVKMMHAMLEANADDTWWDTMPDNMREKVEQSLQQSKNGNVTAHSEIKKRYQKWIVK